MRNSHTFILLAAAALLVGCRAVSPLSGEELALIGAGVSDCDSLAASADSCAGAQSNSMVMRVLTIEDPSDLAVLRTACSDFTSEDLASDAYDLLAARMVATVTSPEQDGVGIAGPQVGLSRRVVAVQRFDKPGEPFEVYPNIRIVARRGLTEAGPEGCLSVPGRRGDVLRYRDISIRYSLVTSSSSASVQSISASTPSISASAPSFSASTPSISASTPSISASTPSSSASTPSSSASTQSASASTPSFSIRDTVERVTGFTAVIFQHECDHLDGVLYIDRLTD